MLGGLRNGLHARQNYGVLRQWGRTLAFLRVLVRSAAGVRNSMHFGAVVGVRLCSFQVVANL